MFSGKKMEEMRKIIKRHHKLFGLLGIMGAWIVIGMVWAGLVTLPLITSIISGGMIGLTLFGVKA